METKKILPKRLKKEPLIEAVFELRFNSSVSASSILPGILFSKLTGNKKIDNLPASQLPEQVRSTDPNLQFAPTVRVQWDNIAIMVSDRSVALACNAPYPGWTAFKAAINTVLKHIEKVGIVTTVLRYSLKYIDIIPAAGIKKQASLVNMALQVGSHTLSQETFQIKLEVPRSSCLNIIFIATDAEAKLKNEVKKGLLIDIDSIVDAKNENYRKVLGTISKKLDKIHDTNCELFFDCLKQSTIDALEPIYE